MITIQQFTRPSAHLVKCFSDVASSEAANLCALPGGLHQGIRLLCGSGRLLGPALTVQAHPGDNLAVLAALTVVQPGDVLVAATGGQDGVAVVGDRIAGMAVNGGAIGIVTDGLARDVAGMAALGISVYARGTCPNAPRREGPGRVGGAIEVGGVAIMAGDLIVADGEGIAVLPQAALSEALEALKRIRREEAEIAQAIKEGQRRPAWVEALISYEVEP